MTGNAKWNTRKPSTCTDITKLSFYITKFGKCGKRILYMQHNSFLGGSDTREVDGIVLLNDEVNMTQQLFLIYLI